MARNGKQNEYKKKVEEAEAGGVVGEDDVGDHGGALGADPVVVEPASDSDACMMSRESRTTDELGATMQQQEEEQNGAHQSFCRHFLFSRIALHARTPFSPSALSERSID